MPVVEKRKWIFNSNNTFDKMKKMYVTVAEFLDNGGNIEKDRLVFYPSYSGYQVSGTFGNIKYNIDQNNNFYYVEIDATPHYI